MNTKFQTVIYLNICLYDFRIKADRFDEESLVRVFVGAVFVNEVSSLSGGVCRIKYLKMIDKNLTRLEIYNMAFHVRLAA